MPTGSFQRPSVGRDDVVAAAELVNAFTYRCCPHRPDRETAEDLSILGRRSVAYLIGSARKSRCLKNFQSLVVASNL